eukprot:scaffold8972_cov118-Isochrysis_galbana.AAC.11
MHTYVHGPKPKYQGRSAARQHMYIYHIRCVSYTQAHTGRHRPPHTSHNIRPPALGLPHTGRRRLAAPIASCSSPGRCWAGRTRRNMVGTWHPLFTKLPPPAKVASGAWHCAAKGRRSA